MKKQTINTVALLLTFLAIALLAGAFLCLFVKHNAIRETVQSTGHRWEYRNTWVNFFGRMWELNYMGFSIKREIAFLVSLGISLVMAIAAVGIRFMRSFFSLAPFVSAILSITIIKSNSTSYVIDRWGSSATNNWIDDLMTFDMNLIPVTIMLMLSFAALLASGILYFIYSRDDRKVKAANKKSKAPEQSTVTPEQMAQMMEMMEKMMAMQSKSEATPDNSKEG